MGTITARDGTEIFYKDWGSGQPVVFSHGWPLTADAWDDQLFLVASSGYRAIAHDRRGGGRSGQPWNGNDLDTYADDLADLIEALDLHDAVLVGHSTGGGEVTHYMGRHGTSRVAKAVLVSAIPPLMLKTDANPGGLPIDVFDGLRADLSADRSQFYKDLSAPFYGANRPGNTVSQGLRDSFWLLSMTVGVKGAYDCIKAFSETDLTEDLKKIDVPDPDHPRRRRPDRAHRRLRPAVLEDRQGRDPQGLSRRPARPRPDHRLQGHLQHRPAQLHQGLSAAAVAAQPGSTSNQATALRRLSPPADDRRDERPRPLPPGSQTPIPRRIPVEPSCRCLLPSALRERRYVQPA